MEVESFFLAVSKATEKAFSSPESIIEKQIRLAGFTIRLRFAGVEMVQHMIPAISHLLIDIDKKKSDYIINIWDSRSSGTEIPNAPCSIDDFQIRGEISGLKSDRFETAYFTHARMLSVLDHYENVGIVCCMDHFRIPAFELACPFRGIFSWILRRNKITMVHAASVGTSDGYVLIGGYSGAGKSSTALRCLIGGLDYLGDDITAISVQNRLPKVHSVYSSGKTLSADLYKFSPLNSSRYSHFEEEYEKEIFFLNPSFADQLCEMGHLCAVVIPHQDPSLEIGIQPLSIAKAINIIGSSTQKLLPDAGNEIIDVLSSILHIVPCYQFNLGNDPDKIASTLTKLILKLKGDEKSGL